MVECQWQPAQRLGKRPRARFVAASGADLQKRNSVHDRQHVERHLVRQPAKVREARREQNAGAGAGQEIGDLLGPRDVVVDEEPDVSLLGEPPQRRLGRLLDVGLLGCRDFELGR
jgi:hypothetical protein